MPHENVEAPGGTWVGPGRQGSPATVPHVGRDRSGDRAENQLGRLGGTCIDGVPERLRRSCEAPKAGGRTGPEAESIVS